MNVTNRQIFFSIITFTIPFVICFLPRVMAEQYGTSGWLCILFMAVFYSIFAGIIAYLGYSHQDKTLFEYAQPLVGKFFAYFFSLIYLIEFFLYTSLLTRSGAEIIHVEFFVNTPKWFLAAVILAAATYAASKGLTNIGRNAEVFGTIMLVVGIFIQLLRFINGDVLNARPFFKSCNPMKLIMNIPNTLYLFSGFEMMTIIPFTKRNGFKSVGAAMLAIFAICGFYILEIESAYMVLGVEDTVNYAYPPIASVRRLDIDIFQFLKRIDLVFITSWITTVYFSISMILFATAEYARKIISKPNNKIVLYVIAILAFIVSLLPEKDTDVYNYLTLTSIIFASMTIIVIPIILLIASGMKKHEKNQNRP